MTITAFRIEPGIKRENTPLAAQGYWYDGNHIRFRSGSAEKIGGWERISNTTYLGVCRSLWNWATLGGQNLMALGTNLKFYIERGGVYYDITPIRSTVTLNNPFDTTIGDTTVLVTDVAHGALTNDFVTFSGATAVGGLDLNGEYQITRLTDDTYNITAAAPASSTANGGGAAVSAAYQLNTGAEVSVPITGFGAGPYGSGPWGVGSVTTGNLGMWSQSNFGEDLIFAQRNGQLCIWDATGGTSARGTLLEDEVGASDVPVAAFAVLVTDPSRFVFAFGTNEIGSATLDPMLIRWSDQEDAVNWTPDATNQAGSLRLSRGSEIVAVSQSRQEILVWTDAAVYSLQYLGAEAGVWGVQLVGENISIVGPNAATYSNGVAYWMGKDRFYRYDGTVTPLRCDVRRYVFSDFNAEQQPQVVCGTNEAFDEIWWFYPSAESDEVDKYVIYNYRDDIWYYGETGRTAWLDSNLRQYPAAACYTQTLVYHEVGVDNKETTTTTAIACHIESAQIQMGDGDRFMYVWQVLPDLLFAGSTAANPTVTVTIRPLKNSGSGFTDPESTSGSSSGGVERILEVPQETYTGTLPIRIRGRQIAVRVESDEIGNTWQWGILRLNARPDGRRG